MIIPLLSKICICFSDMYTKGTKHVHVVLIMHKNKEYLCTYFDYKYIFKNLLTFQIQYVIVKGLLGMN